MPTSFLEWAWTLASFFHRGHDEGGGIMSGWFLLPGGQWSCVC